MNDESRPVKAAPVSTGVPARTGVESSAPAGDAGRRRDRIKLLLSAMTTTTEKIAELLEAAQADGDHRALGYASWTAYVAGEYAESLAGLSAAARRPAVAALAEGGLSTRAIAGIAGVSHSTVVRDRAQVVQDAPPVMDGPRPASEFKSMVAEMGAPSRRRVTGTDGKSYSATAAASSAPAAPRPRRRPPLPDSYGTAVWDLGKLVDRLERLHADDRFKANRESVRQLNRGELTRRTDQLLRILADLDGGDVG
jgi:hypothetical protein